MKDLSILQQQRYLTALLCSSTLHIIGYTVAEAMVLMIELPVIAKGAQVSDELTKLMSECIRVNKLIRSAPPREDKHIKQLHQIDIELLYFMLIYKFDIALKEYDRIHAGEELCE